MKPYLCEYVQGPHRHNVAIKAKIISQNINELWVGKGPFSLNPSGRQGKKSKTE